MTVTEKDIKNALDQYSDQLAALDLIQIEMQEALENSLTQEEKDLLAKIEDTRKDIEAEFAETLSFAKSQIDAAKEQIKTYLLLSDLKKAKGLYHSASVSDGKITITKAKFDELMKQHPDARAYFKVGEKFVTVR